MNRIDRIESYQAFVSEEILSKWSGIVRVWSEPKSAVDGATVLDEIREPIEVTVVEEQKDMYGSKMQRARIRYGEGREGWVLSQALTANK